MGQPGFFFWLLCVLSSILLSFISQCRKPTEFSVFPELMLGSGRNGCEWLTLFFQSLKNHRQPEGDALKVLMGGKFWVLRQMGEAPSGCPPWLGKKGGIHFPAKPD